MISEIGASTIDSLLARKLKPLTYQPVSFTSLALILRAGDTLASAQDACQCASYILFFHLGSVFLFQSLLVRILHVQAVSPVSVPPHSNGVI
jgi:hypothetical protein